jgi:hypothetical protein
MKWNTRFRDVLLNGEVFYIRREAKILIERLRRHYSHRLPTTGVRRHDADGTKANHALNWKRDHPIGTLQTYPKESRHELQERD